MDSFAKIERKLKEVNKHVNVSTTMTNLLNRYRKSLASIRQQSVDDSISDSEVGKKSVGDHQISKTIAKNEIEDTRAQKVKSKDSKIKKVKDSKIKKVKGSKIKKVKGSKTKKGKDKGVKTKTKTKKITSKSSKVEDNS